MLRLVSTVLVAVLVIGMTLEGRCLVSCAAEHTSETSAAGCHESTLPAVKIGAGHDCSSHLDGREAAARPERSAMSGPGPALAVAAFDTHARVPSAVDCVSERPASGPPLAPPLLVAVRI